MFMTCVHGGITSGWQLGDTGWYIMICDGDICAWPLIKYIYIHLCIYLYVHDTWWSLTVCLCMCVCLVHNHDTCCLNYSMFFCSDLPPPLQVSILAWKLIPRKWKETCWKTIPKLKSKKQLHCFTQIETIIFKNQTITIKEQRLI